MNTSVLVSAVMPCLNEEETLAVCIEKAQRCFAALGIPGQVVVADNGSTDGSVAVAQRLGVKIVHERIKGYGAALMAAIDAADGEIIVMADADDSYDWEAIGPFIEKIRAGYELVVGNRFKGGIRPGAMPTLHRYFGNPLLSFIARTVYRVPIGDFHCGMRAFTKAAYRRMGLRTPGMEFATEMVAAAAQQGLRIAEIPIVLYPDKRNRPPHLRSFRDGWRHLRFIITCAPDYLYILPGAAMFITGVLLQLMLVGGPIAIFGFHLGIHYLALGSMLTLVGLNILNLGVLAKVIMVQMYPNLRSAIAHWVLHSFKLEWGLLTGLLMLMVGTAIDIAILVRWLRTGGGPLEETVHLSFVATTAVVIGVNLLFGAFLLNLLVLAHRNREMPRQASSKTF